MIKDSTTIYLVRHGQSAANQAGVIGGQTDPDLTEKGKDEARATKAKLSDVKFDDVFSSDLKRAIKTAGIIFGKPVPVSHRLAELRERNYGSMEGLPDHHFLTYFNSLTSLPNHERWHYKHVHDMESDHELINRYMTVLTKIAKENKGQNILVVAHGAAIRTLLFKLGHGNYEDLPPKSFKNGGFVELKYNNGFRVVRIEGIDPRFVRRIKLN